ncbi:MAG: aminopeptidase P family protein [Anaerolineae bacterium]
MLHERLSRLQGELQNLGLDCLTLIAGTNLKYMTGLSFHLMERPVLGLFPARGTPALVLPALEITKLEAARLYEITPFTYTDEQGPQEAVRQAVMALPEIQRMGVEYLQMRVLELRLVQHHIPAAAVVDGTPAMDALRLHKGADEIAAMREAVRISQEALRRVVAGVKPGMTEREIAGLLDLAQRQAGGAAEAFESIVLAGANAANPHGVPGDYRVREGDVLLLDFGTTVGGYVSDITRTFFVGEPGAHAREVYEVVRAANEAGRAKAGPGVPCQEVDRAARQVIEAAGYGRYFIHRTGHGLGMDPHERPYIIEGNEQLLEPGMTFTIEPGIYIPGEIGVRIEDNIVITDDGAESLTTFPRDLMVIGEAG